MSKQNKWTPEPWKAEDFDERCTFVYGGLFALGAAPLTPAAPVVACCDLHCGGGIEQSRCNGRRIVACVNACTGLADPAAEIKAMREAIQAAVSVRDRLADRLSVYWTDGESLDLDAKLKSIAALKAEGEVKNG